MNIFFFFFNDTATTEIYTLSLHDALPIWQLLDSVAEEAIKEVKKNGVFVVPGLGRLVRVDRKADRKSTRLNSSHGYISYAVFCLKKKKKQHQNELRNSTKKQQINYERYIA